MKVQGKATLRELLPRDPHAVQLQGRGRKFTNRARQAKADRAGRKAKHKGRD